MFFDKGILSLLYFPDDHKMAVYIPYFVPVLLPLLVGVLREGKVRVCARVRVHTRARVQGRTRVQSGYRPSSKKVVPQDADGEACVPPLRCAVCRVQAVACAQSQHGQGWQNEWRAG